MSDRRTLTDDERIEFCTWIVLTSNFDEDELDTWSDSELIDYMNAAGGQWNEDAQAWIEKDGRDVISIAYPPERWWMDGYWTNVRPEDRDEVQP